MRTVQAQQPASSSLPSQAAQPSQSGFAGPPCGASSNAQGGSAPGPGAAMQAAPAPPPVPEARPGETSVNIAIEDMKDFQESVAPVRELYSEFTTADGNLLFECQGLTKDTGIDLMDCPLNISLKLRVRRRMPQGAHVLWHVVLPMPLISKHLLSPPHEWQTWLGLLPNTMNLDMHPPDVMFTQSVHLISRPEFPKLRLRFKYHNPELQAQLQAKKEREEQELKQREDMNKNVGKKAFEDLQNLFKVATPAPSATPAVPSAGPPVSSASSTAGYTHEQTPAAAAAIEAQQHQRESAIVASSLNFATVVWDLLAASRADAVTMPLRDLPALPTVAEVVASSSPSQMLDASCKQLAQRLQAMVTQSTPAINGRGPSNAEVEPQLIEGLRMALMGIMEDSEGPKIPRTSTNLSAASTEQMASIQSRFPHLWEVYREVSALAKERASLCQEQSQWIEDNRRLREDLLAMRQSLELAQQSESKKHFEKLLAQQRQMQQLTLDKEVANLRHQLAGAHQSARDKDAEVARLRAELEDYRKQHSLDKRQPGSNSHNL